MEDYNDIAALFRSTAEGETGHAYGHLEYLEQCGDPATGMPFGATADNLKTAVAGETHEYTEVTAIERCSGHDGTYAVKREFHETSMKIVRPVVNQMKRTEAEHYGSDCPMAGHHIEQGMADGSRTEHPMSLLRKAYGI